MNDALIGGVGVYAFVCLVMAAAALLQSVSGFGFNLIAVPLLTVVVPPRIIVPAVIIAWIPVGMAFSIRQWRAIDVRRVAGLMLGAIPGLVVGVWLLAEVDAWGLKRFIGLVTIGSTVLLGLKSGRPLRHEYPWVLLAGTLSGVLGGSTAMSGPPVLLLGLKQSWESRSFRADLIAYFTLLSVVATALLVRQGMLPVDSVKCAVIGAPGLTLGSLTGAWLSSRVTGKRFRALVICVMCVAGLMPWLTGP